MKTLINNKSVWLNYHHLYYFMMVASEGSIAGVAKKLNIGQSALSIQLKQFEENIGVDLFVRSHKKLDLTENGKAALDYAREIFKLGNEMIETLHDYPNPERLHVQIGALDTIPKHLTLQVARKAFASRPCSISILEGKGDELMRELSQHRLDVVITNKQLHSTSTPLYAKKIARLPLLVFGSKKFTPLRKKFPQSLDGQPFVFATSESQSRYEIEHYCKLHGLRPDIVAETQDVIMQKFLAIDGVGLIVVPEFSVKEYLAKKELFLIGRLDDVFEELFLVTASRKIENPVAIDLMKNFELKE